MSNSQLYGKEARAKLLAGVEHLSKAVTVTLGPAGRNVLFRHMNQVFSTKDGVTVASEINLADPFESIGAEYVKGAARQTVDEAGDGTTTATLLTYELFKQGCAAIDDGAEPVALTRGIERATRAVCGEYDAKARKFKGGILSQYAKETTPELAFNAAKISSNGDEKIAKVVSEAVIRCGVDGSLTIGNSYSHEHVLDVTEGLQFNSGYAHTYFMNDGQKQRTVYEQVTIALINRRISTGDEAAEILKGAIKCAESKGRSVAILILCDDVDPEALNVFVTNKMKQQLPIPVVVVRTPLWGDARRDLLEDISILTEAKRLETVKGKGWDGLQHSDFGFAERVVVTNSTTLITCAPMDESRRRRVFDPYLEGLQTIVDDASLHPSAVDAAKGRLAALRGGVAVIKVGGTSANDVSEVKFRVEDAIHATRAAVADGVVPGGGSALLFAQMNIERPLSPVPDDDEIGFNLLIDCLSSPMGQIVKNAGYDADKTIETVREYAPAENFLAGFDASVGNFIDDMFAAGIVDPLRVVRTALNAAASAACILLKTETVIGQDVLNTIPQPPTR